MRQAGEVYYLHADHPSASLRAGLGTVALTTDSAGAVKHQVRHLPFGGERWSSGSDVSDRDFTDQLGTSFGLIEYGGGTRYYDPLLGRFVSADSIVPNFANPQDLNRYSYVRNNPLKYVDPTGHLSEDQIMKVLGAETWDEVLSNFEGGGEYEGRWGWLETLRRIREGRAFEIYDTSRSFRNPIYRGGLLVIDGEFTLESWDGEYMSLKSAGSIGNLHSTRYTVSPWARGGFAGDPKDVAGPPNYIGIADRQYNHLKFDSGNVNWGNVAWDSVSTIASLAAANEFVQGIRYGDKIGEIATVLAPTMSGAGVFKSLLVDADPNAALLSAGSFIPGAVGGGFSLAAVYFDLRPGFYYGP